MYLLAASDIRVAPDGLLFETVNYARWIIQLNVLGAIKFPDILYLCKFFIAPSNAETSRGRKIRILTSPHYASAEPEGGYFALIS